MDTRERAAEIAEDWGPTGAQIAHKIRDMPQRTDEAAALAAIVAITEQTHAGRERAYTALSKIHMIARAAMATT